jgi:hypothetical protein
MSLLPLIVSRRRIGLRSRYRDDNDFAFSIDLDPRDFQPSGYRRLQDAVEVRLANVAAARHPALPSELAS